ncbi:hypothetical protein YC2023_078874 [Brassica napus]
MPILSGYSTMLENSVNAILSSANRENLPLLYPGPGELLDTTNDLMTFGFWSLGRWTWSGTSLLQLQTGFYFYVWRSGKIKDSWVQVDPKHIF